MNAWMILVVAMGSEESAGQHSGLQFHPERFFHRKFCFFPKEERRLEGDIC